MKINGIKNLVLIVLVMAALYQTGTLWLGDAKSHNVFYYFMDTFVNRYRGSSEDISIIKPSDVVLGYGNKKYSKLLTGDRKETLIEETEGVINKVLSEGKFDETKAIDWNEYLETKSLLLQFSFNVSFAEYYKGFNIKSINELSTSSKFFDYIALVPSNTTGGDIKLYFIDSEKGEAYLYKLNNVNKAQEVYSYISKMQDSEEGLLYISTIQSGFNVFKNNVFVPQWAGEGFLYKYAEKINPYEYNGAVDIAVAENMISGFFNNTSVVQKSNNTPMGFMFSNENTVVKYFMTGILEYYNYETSFSKEEQTLATAYSVSNEFLKKDKSLNTEVSLSGIELSSEGLIFYYDYALDNFPMILSNSLKEKLNMQHAIEIIVSDNSVKKYRRYAYNFVLNTKEEKRNVDVDFSAALSEAIRERNSKDTVTEVLNIDLLYYIEDSDNVFLKWITNIENNNFITDSKKEE